MKKIFLMLFLLFALFPQAMILSAEEYSPHYLPGGRNYLSTDNFSYYDNILISDSAFAVKPFTTYTLSFPRSYYDPGEISGIITFFENEDELESLPYDSSDMFVYSSEPHYGKITFQTPATANYLSLTLFDNNDYLKRNNVSEIILEEGSSFTSFEPFIIGNTIDINGPYFMGTGTIIVNVDNPYTINEITSTLSAYDAIEGDVSSRIQIINDGYSAHKNTIGEYDINYSVSDLSGNETTFTMMVKVVDITKPIITGITSIVLSYPNVTTIEAIKANLSASDNVDGDISNTIELVEENYLPNQLKLGIYELIFKVTDSSNNVNYISVEVEVVDEKSPIFTGPSSFVIGYNQTLTIADIIASQSVLDDYDLDLTHQIQIKTDLYTPNIKKIGSYPIVLKVTDSSGNTTEKTISVQVTDGIGPVVYLDTSIIMVYNDTILGLSDFTQILINSGELDANTDYFVHVVFDSYTSRSTERGVYHIALEYKTEQDVLKLSKTLEIVVKDKSVDYHHQLPDIDLKDESDEQKFIIKYWQYFAIGGLFLLTLISNIVWVLLYRKR